MVLTSARSVVQDAHDEPVGIVRSRLNPRLREVEVPKGPPGSAMRRRVVAGLVLLDLAVIVVSFLLITIIRDASSPLDWTVLPTLVLPPFFFAGLQWKSYDVRRFDDPWKAARAPVHALIAAVAAVVVAAYGLKVSAEFSRITLVASAVLAMALLVPARLGFIVVVMRRFGGPLRSIVLIQEDGTSRPSGRFWRVIAADAGFNPANQDPALYSRLAQLLNSADSVVVSCQPPHRAAWSRMLKGACIQSEIVVPELAPMGALGLAHIGGVPSLVVGDGGLGRFDTVLKRAFDIAVALTGLACLWPLMLGTAVAIRLESKGPVLFRQKRIGHGNATFRVLKFRSMYHGSKDRHGHQSTLRGDARITRVGRFIRATSIDELPQLLNVLFGSMSIVGPRPHAKGSRAADKLFWEIDDRYWQRHSAKPGMTGLAQVRGHRGATTRECDLSDRLQADLEYASNWSIGRDLQIIAMTFAVLFHRNAY